MASLDKVQRRRRVIFDAGVACSKAANGSIGRLIPRVDTVRTTASAKPRRWRGRQASRAWRASAQGKACRREQAQRYRRRIPLVVLPESLFTAGPAEPERSPESPALSAPAEASVLPAPEAPEAREGQRPALKSDDFSLRWCERPGCYEWFAVAWALSPQRFCSSGCRRALRNVLDREARYRQRRRDGDRPLQRRSRPASMRPP